MRSLIYLIVIGAAAYLGYNYYMDHYAGKSSADEAPTEASAEQPRTAERASAPNAPAAPEFKSKIPLPDGSSGKHLAKTGVYYVLQRAKIEHANGIAAVVPGEEVRLIMRKENGTMKVSNGKYEFEMKESQLTNDLDLARDVERKYALTHPPARTQ